MRFHPLVSHDVPRVDILHIDLLHVDLLHVDLLHVDLYVSARRGCDRCLCAIDIRVTEAINVRTGQGVNEVYCNVRNALVSMCAACGRW